MRGTEDLGNGTKAIFNFEQDFDVGDNSVPNGHIAPVGGNHAFSKRTDLYAAGAKFVNNGAAAFTIS